MICFYVNRSEGKVKSSIEEARAQMEKTISKNKKQNEEVVKEIETSSETVETPTEKKEPTPTRTPEEIKQMREDMVTKQKEFIDHRKQV